MSIPMPGHSVGEESKSSVFRDIEDSRAPIDEHDAVYVLTDTRESRWLPTVICADKKQGLYQRCARFQHVRRHASRVRRGCGVGFETRVLLLQRRHGAGE